MPKLEKKWTKHLQKYVRKLRDIWKRTASRHWEEVPLLGFLMMRMIKEFVVDVLGFSLISIYIKYLDTLYEDWLAHAYASTICNGGRLIN